jgi:RimJ/RimL family protein N-acetyltransferase
MNVRIRPLSENDAYISVHWRNAPEIWQLTGSRPDKLITVDDEIAWIRHAMSDASGRRYAIIADERYVGNIYITDIAERTGEYHIFIGETGQWGRGIGRQASKCLFEEARRLGLVRLRLRVKEGHLVAVTLYESLGFTASGKDGDDLLMEIDLYQAS